jgi:c(7)-type cytochrome triheme protein
MNCRSRFREGRSNEAAWARRTVTMFLLAVSVMVLCSHAGNAHAVASGVTITYSGQGAGEVTFDGTVHAKTLSCSDCHETDPSLPALYEMKKGAEKITMNKITRGRSCGKCHEVSLTNYLICSKCHHNK